MTAPEFPPAVADNASLPGAAGGAPRVLGLDLSIAATGVADHQHGVTATHTIRTDPGDYAKGPEGTWQRLCYVAETIDNIVHDDGPRPALVTVEGPSFGSKGDAFHQLAGLWWLTYDVLLRARLPVAVITPGLVKKYATGKGTATKPDMRVALLKRTGIDERDDNRVDAFFLAAMGADRLGHPIVSVPESHRAALAKVAWPTIQEAARG